MEVDHQCRVILKNYFYLIYQRYRITVPQEADWKFPQLPANVPWLIAVEVPRMLVELGEMSEDTRIPAMVELCEYFSGHVAESNFLDTYTTTMDILINHISSLGKMQVFCAFSAAYCVYLCKQHNVSDSAAMEVYLKAQKIFQFRFKFWLDCDHGWVSVKYNVFVNTVLLFQETFLAEGKRMIREKDIADYQASLVKSVVHKGIVLTVVTGLTIALIATLKSKLGH